MGLAGINITPKAMEGRETNQHVLFSFAKGQILITPFLKFTSLKKLVYSNFTAI